MSARLATLSIVLAAAVAHADLKGGTSEDARRYFEAGKQAYEAEQFAAAALAFEEAYRADPRPAILFSLAQAHRKQYYLDRDPGRLRHAVDLYRKYVAENPNGTRMADALQILSTLEPLHAKLPAAAASALTASTTQILVSSRSPGAAVSLDGGQPVKIPVLLDVKPGQHRAVVTAPGFEPDTSTVIAVEGRLVVHATALKEKPARLAIRGDDGASVSLDGRLVGQTPFPRPLELTAGRRFLTISARGHRPVAREITLRRGEELKIDGDLPATGQRIVAWGLLVGAGALAIGGGTTTLLALKAQSDAEGFLDGQDHTDPERAAYEDDVARRDRLVTTSIVLYSGAALLGATALFLFLADNPSVEAPPGGPSITPMVTPEGDVGVSLGTPF